MKLIGINRHRIKSDGTGVRTLIAFSGCPLRCKYCLNPHCFDSNSAVDYTVDEVMSIINKDKLYYKATNGGVTFGGGEPLLHTEDIISLCEAGCSEFDINIETSLNVPLSSVQKVAPYISQWFIDIKDFNPVIYKAYTGKSNEQVITNLKWLIKNEAGIAVRIPHIPEFNKNEDVRTSIEFLKSLGLSDSNFDEFEYVTNRDD